MFLLYSSLFHSSLICWVRKASHSGTVCWSQLPSFIELCVSSDQKAADHICMCALFETSASTFSSIPFCFSHSAYVVLKSGDPSLCPCSLLFFQDHLVILKMQSLLLLLLFLPKEKYMHSYKTLIRKHVYFQRLPSFFVSHTYYVFWLGKSSSGESVLISDKATYFYARKKIRVMWEKW